jgi:hypothetical protein
MVKKKHGYYSAAFIIIAAVASAIFVRNNKDLFFSKSAKAPAAAKAAEVPAAPPQPKVVQTPLQKSESLTVVPEAAVPTDSLLLSDISCKLDNREGLRVILSLELFFPPGALKKEILLKRDNLKVMVQKSIVGKSMQELTIDSLRPQMLRSMNRILEEGTITDVEFRNFSIDKVP